MKHQLPALKYDLHTLEPYIDARTMRLHHHVHHRAYVDNLNAALDPLTNLKSRSATWLLRNLEKVPEDARLAVRHNAGGHVNHSLFWLAMKPVTGHSLALGPSGLLREAIDRNFGGLAELKAKFDEAGAHLFGSGWIWLVRDRQDGGKLGVITTAGHDNPVMQGRFPILLNDVWEHAYYLRYESRRPEYLRAWWPLVDWEEADRRFSLSNSGPEDVWEAEGGHLLTD